MKKIGFTLAEVLITLAIIGTVAALTIPSVVRNYQKQQTVVQLKKVYSALSNTTNLAIADNGPIQNWAIGEDSTGQAAVDFSDTYLIPYLKVSKNCGTKTTQDCAFRYSHLSSPAISSFSANHARFFLNDGSLVGILIINQETSRYARIYVDINGQKKPNIFGRDIFYFVYYIMFPSASMTGKFLPAEYGRTRAGLMEEGVYGTCTKNAGDWGGRYCAALILKDGWKIADDYPW